MKKKSNKDFKKIYEYENYGDWLKSWERHYTSFERPYWHEQGNWEGIVYDNWFKVKLKKIFGKNNLEYFD